MIGGGPAGLAPARTYGLLRVRLKNRLCVAAVKRREGDKRAAELAHRELSLDFPRASRAMRSHPRACVAQARRFAGSGIISPAAKADFLRVDESLCVIETETMVRSFN